MSISWGAQYPKLKSNMRLAINRLKLMGKKKTEMAMKARTEIADYIVAHKEDRARIRVEHIIREDYLVEAYEILEMYCDLLLARFGLIEQMKTLDDGIAEAVISILWAAPRIACDIAEFKTISDQLTVKYGKPFAEAARQNQLEFPAKVNPRLIQKLSVAAPPKLLVEKYLILIAQSAGIDFMPDPDVMRDDEVAQAEKMLIDFKQAGATPNPVPTNDAYGWQLGGGAVPPNPLPNDVLPATPAPMYQPPPNVAPPPAFPPVMPPGVPPGDIGGGAGPKFPPGNPGGGGGGIYEVPGAGAQNHLYDQVPGDYVTPHNPAYDTPNVPPQQFNLPQIGPMGAVGPDLNYPTLSQRNSMIGGDPNKASPSAPPQSIRKPDNLNSEIHFPEPPGNFSQAPPAPSGNDLDFDELARRFDQLKKRT